MKVWTPPEKGRSRYAARSIGGVLVAVFFCMAIICIVMLLAIHFGWPVWSASAVVCAVATVLCIWLAVAAGRRSLRDALMFLLDGKDRLFVLDVRLLAGLARNITGFVRAAVEIQRELERLKNTLPEMRKPPNAAVQIVQVEHIAERARGRALLCRVRYAGGREEKRTYLLVRGYEDEDWLLRELERRMPGEALVEPRQTRAPLYAVLSLAALAVCTVLCVLSHPAVAVLPQCCMFLRGLPLSGGAGNKALSSHAHVPPLWAHILPQGGSIMFGVILGFIATHMLYFALHLESSSFPKPLSAKEEIEAFAAFKAGDMAATTCALWHTL